MNSVKDFKTVLKNERKKRKLTQEEVAKLIGISRSYYSDIERGLKIPSGKTLFKINEVLPFFLVLNDADRVYKDGEAKCN